MCQLLSLQMSMVRMSMREQPNMEIYLKAWLYLCLYKIGAEEKYFFNESTLKKANIYSYISHFSYFGAGNKQRHANFKIFSLPTLSVSLNYLFQ